MSEKSPPSWEIDAGWKNNFSIALTPERYQRWQVIGPFVTQFKKGSIPRDMSKDSLKEILELLKEEGNHCFRDKDYAAAYDQYSAALNACKHLQIVCCENVVPEFLSTVFSNRAACLLKMDYFQDCIYDCETALQQNINNLKAYYRCSLAYKGLKNWRDAERAAVDGRNQALVKSKTKEAKEFDELILEVRTHLIPSESLNEVNTTADFKLQLSSSVPATSDTGNALHRRMQLDGDNTNESLISQCKELTKLDKKLNESNDYEQNQKRVEVASNRESKQPAIRNVSLVAKGVDSSWLEGTNVVISKRIEPVLSRKKAKKQAANTARSQYQGRFAALPCGNDSDSSNNHSDDMQNNSIQVNESYNMESQSIMTTNLVDLRTSAVKGEQLQQSDTGGVDHIGLDDFDLDAQDQFTEVTYKQYKMSPQYDVSHVTSVSKNAELTYVGDFPILQSSRQLLHPFDVRYDFTLVCDKCYLQSAKGHYGYIKLGRLPHECRHDVLLVKTKNDLNAQWAKIRQRNIKFSYVTHYKLCREYASGNFCRVREVDCSYAHYEDEAYFWSLDRDGKFCIASFIRNMKLCLCNGMLYSIPSNSDLPIDKSLKQSEVDVNETNPLQHLPQNKYILNRNDSSGYSVVNNSKLVNRLRSEFNTQSFSKARSQVQFIKENENSKSIKSDIHRDDYADKDDMAYQTEHLLDNPPVSSARKRGGTLIEGNIDSEKRLMEIYSSDTIDKPLQDVQSSVSRPDQNAVVPFELKLPPDHNIHSEHPTLFTQQHNQPLGQQSYNINQIQRVNVTCFPLNDHHFRLVCDLCFNPLNSVGFYFFNGACQHTCLENILAVQRKEDSVWIKVRERKNHRNFQGSYKLCKSQDRQLPVTCHHGDICLFAHNYVEQLLWTKEKDEEFNISEFICQWRSEDSVPRYTITTLLTMYPGELRFLCGSCYYEKQRLCPESSTNPVTCSSEQHEWQVSKTLVHYSVDGKITIIGQRAFWHKSAYFNLCRHQQFCQRRPLSQCSFAHSLIERDIWYAERDMDATQEQLVLEAQRIITTKRQVHSSSSYTSSAKISTVQLTNESSIPAMSNSAKINLKCPYNVLEICGLCWQKGAYGTCDPKKGRCNGPGGGHIWKQNKIIIVLPKKKKVPTATLR